MKKVKTYTIWYVIGQFALTFRPRNTFQLKIYKGMKVTSWAISAASEKTKPSY